MHCRSRIIAVAGDAGDESNKDSLYEGEVALLRPEVFYPEIAKWNADIFQACDTQGQTELCRDHYTDDTVAVHHWACSWCRGSFCAQEAPIEQVVPTVVRGRHMLQALRHLQAEGHNASLNISRWCC